MGFLASGRGPLWLLAAKKPLVQGGKICYTSVMLSNLLSGVLHSLVTAVLAQGDEIKLMQPVGDVKTIQVTGQGALGPLLEYFNAIYPWAAGCAAGIAVFHMVFGAIGMINSGGDSGARSAAIEKMKWAVLGLLILLLSSVILKTINPAFYQ